MTKFATPQDLCVTSGQVVVDHGKVFIAGEEVPCQRIVIDCDWQTRRVKVSLELLPKQLDVSRAGDKFHYRVPATPMDVATTELFKKHQEAIEGE